MNRRFTAQATVIFLSIAGIASGAIAAEPKSTATLIQNARIFDGKNETLAEGLSVLVEGNKIAKIAKAIPAPAGATVIDAKGRVLMPGLTGMHWHVISANPSMPVLMNSDLEYLAIAGAEALVRR